MPFVEVTDADLKFLQDARRTHSVPGAVGAVMPQDESVRKFGEPYMANPPTVRRLPSPQDWVDKQINNISAVGETNYRVGIANPKKDWQQAALQGQGAYETAMRNPATLQRRESSIRQVSSDEWAAQAERGAGRLVQGVIDRRPKIERKVMAYHSKLTSHLQRIDAMPANTDSEREARMTANVRGLRAMKGTI